MDSAAEMMVRIDAVISVLRSHENEREALGRSLAEDERDLADFREQKDVLIQAHEGVALFLERGKEHTKKAFEEINTTAVSSVFGEGYEVELQYSQNRGKSSAAIFIYAPMEGVGHIPTEMDYRGGGCIDLISLTFYLCQLELIDPRPEGPLMADEPFAALDAERSRRCSGVMRSILNPDGKGADGVGRQMIMSTHKPMFYAMADRIFKFTKAANEITEIEEVTDTVLAEGNE